ncbi:MAG: peptidylglycine alpha-amidating monooxygenase [Myxococcales bacterium]|nr:peptidylglycine alpha-amidating monooxygenase [Myxococcales bacterium]
MQRASSGALALCLFGGLAACYSDALTPTNPIDGGVAPAAASPLPCDVDKVLAERCRSCHGAKPAFGAPMPLVTFDDLRAPSKSAPERSVYELVKQRIHDDARPMPQAPNARLNPDETATLDGWIVRGAPRGEGTCTQGSTTPPPAPNLVPTLSCPTPGATLSPGTPFSMPAGVTDLYAYYGVSVNVGAKRHITAIAPVVQNTNIVHHILLLQVDAPVSPTPTTVAPAGKMRLLFAWAPGGKALDLPPNVGFPEEGTAHYVVQIHYNNLAGLPNQTDASGFSTCTGAPREHEADVMAFGTEAFSLPPRTKTAKRCTVEVPADYAGLTLFSAMPHQHQLGTSISTTLRRGTQAIDLGTRSPWNFQNQEWSPIAAVTQTGDKIETRCEWVNGGTEAVSYGEKTLDEMCYSFTLYYPRRTAPDWSWDVPAKATTCVDE